MKKIKVVKADLAQAKDWAADIDWLITKQYEKDSEYMSCVSDILEHDIFQMMDQYIQHGHTTCKQHCLQVSYMSFKMCKKYQWDYRSVARAALLHDLFLYDWHTHARETGNHFHGYTHPRVAMNNAIKYFGITAKEQNMILRHMWPLTVIPPKYREGYALLYADKFCGLVEVATHLKTWFLYALNPWYLN